VSAVTAVFADDVDPYRARQLVAEKVASAAGALPAGVDPPELGPMTGGLGEVYHLALRSPTRSPSELLDLATFEVAPILRAVPGVVEVNTWGGELPKLRCAPTCAWRATASAWPSCRSRSRVVAVAGERVAGERGQRLVRGEAARDPALAALVVARRADVVVDVADVGWRRAGRGRYRRRPRRVYVMRRCCGSQRPRRHAARAAGRRPREAAARRRAILVYDRATLVDATRRRWAQPARGWRAGGDRVVAGSLRALAWVVALAIPAAMLVAAVRMACSASAATR
jgi:cobalt-zinc-cadmium resistance protein CzcA